MRKDTRFARPPLEEIQAKLPPGTLSDTQSIGVWNVMARADDPSDVSHKYRSYRDSDYCAVPREKLRAMRDTMITSMRESNRNDSNPRKEKKAGTHYDRGHLHSNPGIRKGA
jgi:hypothetical protein